MRPSGNSTLHLSKTSGAVVEAPLFFPITSSFCSLCWVSSYSSFMFSPSIWIGLRVIRVLDWEPFPTHELNGINEKLSSQLSSFWRLQYYDPWSYTKLLIWWPCIMSPTSTTLSLPNCLKMIWPRLGRLVIWIAAGGEWSSVSLSVKLYEYYGPIFPSNVLYKFIALVSLSSSISTFASIRLVRLVGVLFP